MKVQAQVHPTAAVREALADIYQAAGVRERFDGIMGFCEDIDEAALVRAGYRLAKKRHILDSLIKDAERYRAWRDSAAPGPGALRGSVS